MNKNKLITRLVSALFIITILFSLFANIFVFAVETDETSEIDEEIIYNHNRFMTTDKGFVVNGGTLKIENENVTFFAEKTDIEISADAQPFVSNTSTNAVNIVFENSTGSQNLIFEYTYYDDTNTEIVETENIDILSWSEKKTVTVYVGESIADKISSYKITLKNASIGKFILYSVTTVSIYESKNQYIGNILSMVYNDRTNAINIQGTIKHDIMIANAGAVIELYSIPTGIDNSFVLLEDSVPYATIPLSIRFEFNTALKELWDRYNKYVVVLHKTNGEKLLVDSCKYLGLTENKNIKTTEKSANNSFKGIETIFTASATEVGVGTAIVDVYLDKLQNTQKTGYFYSAAGENFYFDRAYILSVDKQVKALYGAGSKIYLRFLVSNDGTTQLFAQTMNNDMVKNRAVVMDNLVASQHIHVFTDYLANRYSGKDYGKIDGIILGKSIDNAIIHNYAYDMSMCEYAKLYAAYFAVVTLTAKKSNPEIEMIIPFSANIVDPSNSISRDNNYNRELLMDSIIKILTDDGRENLFSFTTMIESEHSPFKLKNIKIQNNEDESETSLTQIEKHDINCGFITAHNISLLDKLFSQVVKNDGVCRDEYIFLWEPSEEISEKYLEAFYAYTFYTLYFDSNSKCFITSFHSEEMVETFDRVSKLKYIMKYIDTGKNAEVTSHIPELLGFTSWQSIVEDFYASFAVLRTLYEIEFTYEIPKDVIGSFSLWNFEEATGSSGWFPSSYCDSVSINVTNQFSRNLMCSINAKNSMPGEYSSISYVYDFPETLTHAKYLSIDAAVEDDSNDDSLFEIKAIINGENVTLEAKRTITKNGRISLIFDLSRAETLKKAEYFTISIKEISGKSGNFKLHIFDISIHSDRYNNEDFSNKINVERDRIKAEINGEYSDDVQSSKLWMALLITGIITTGIVVLLFIQSGKKRV